MIGCVSQPWQPCWTSPRACRGASSRLASPPSGRRTTAMRTLSFALFLCVSGVWGRAGPLLAEEPRRFHDRTLAEWQRLLRSDDPRTRSRSATALGLGPFGKAALPDLRQALQDRDADVRLSAVVALGHLGPAARPALPALLKLQQ